jgi:hypothetical protein
MNQSPPQRLREYASQPDRSFRVTKGGKVITQESIDSGEWKTWPGAIIAEGVRVLNPRSRNGFDFSPVMESVARFHQSHTVSLEHEEAHGNKRPVSSTFGSLRNGRVEDGSVVADHHMLQEHSETAAYVERYVKEPASVMLSIEVDEGEYELGEALQENLRPVVNISSMLDTALVRRGGNTHRIYESDHSDSEKTMNEKLIESYEKRIAEACACEKQAKDDLQSITAERDKALADLQAAQAKLDEQAGQLAVAESQQKVREQAAESNVRLSETQVKRYAKFDEAELKEQLQEDARRQKESKPYASAYDGPEPTEEDDDSFIDSMF